MRSSNVLDDDGDDLEESVDCDYDGAWCDVPL